MKNHSCYPFLSGVEHCFFYYYCLLTGSQMGKGTGALLDTNVSCKGVWGQL